MRTNLNYIMEIHETRDSKVAATLVTLGHPLRQTDPCTWYREGEREYGVFFHETSLGAPLTIAEVLESYRDPSEFDRCHDAIVAAVPAEQRQAVSKLIHRACVASIREGFSNYRFPVMSELHRSKSDLGMIVERRGNKTLYVGKAVSSDQVSELKKEGGF